MSIQHQMCRGIDTSNCGSRGSWLRSEPTDGQGDAEIRRVLEVGDVLDQGEAVDERSPLAAEPETRLVFIGADLLDGAVLKGALARVELHDHVRVPGDSHLIGGGHGGNQAPAETNAQDPTVRPDGAAAEVDALPLELTLKRGLQAEVVRSGGEERPLTQPCDLYGAVEDDAPPLIERPIVAKTPDGIPDSGFDRRLEVGRLQSSDRENGL